MEKSIIKIIALENDFVLISKIEEVGAEIGEPDCKLVNPFVLKKDKTMEPLLCDFTNENVFMISSEKILTMADPTTLILEKYEQLIK